LDARRVQAAGVDLAADQDARLAGKAARAPRAREILSAATTVPCLRIDYNFGEDCEFNFGVGVGLTRKTDQDDRRTAVSIPYPAPAESLE
jgi:hypothetical protein